ncbi:MAG: hypothetical protein GVY18_02705 [Bacteroidetes bacterium]|jgi:chromosome segregation ATPase|nr:hypothetical protein [Bacteroidota bacterium]
MQVRTVLAGSLLALMLLAACSDSGETPEDAARNAERLSARVQQLETENAALQAATERKDDIFQAYSGLINQTLRDLEGLTEREGILRQIRIDVEEGQADSQGGLRTIEDRLNDNLAAIENYIRESKRQRDELRQMLEQREEEQLPQADLERMQTTIERLSALVDEKERTIAALRRETNRLLARVDTLRQQNDSLATRNTELRQAFYVIGTDEDLERKGIIQKDGGVLGIGKTTRIDQLDRKHFSTADVSLAEIFIGWDLEDYTILSDHRGSEQLYAFQQRDGEVYLSIANPEAFWQISRYLVVEIGR